MAVGAPEDNPLPDGNWYKYPVKPAKPAGVAGPFAALLPVTEIEPNDTPGTAKVIPLGEGPGDDRDLDITGSLSNNTASLDLNKSFKALSL